MNKIGSILPLLGFLVVGGWFAYVFNSYPVETAIRADATIKYEKTRQWLDHGSFYYQYPQAMDPEARGIPYHLSGAMPHLSSFKGKKAITYPESFAILTGGWVSLAGPSTLFLLPILFLLLEVVLFYFVAVRFLRLAPLLATGGGILLLFATPHFIQDLQLQEMTVASSLTLAAVAISLREKFSIFAAFSAALLMGIAFSMRQEAAVPALLLFGLIILRSRNQGRGSDGWLATLKSGPVLTFALVFALCLGLYLWYNWVLYEAPLGSRYYAVKESDPALASRWHILKSVLVGNFDARRPILGLVGQMPFLFIALLLWPLCHKRMQQSGQQLWIFGLLSALLIGLIAPNDSWGGWGQRFTMVIHPELLLGFLAVVSASKNMEGPGLRRAAVSVLGLSILAALMLARFGWKLENSTLQYTTELQTDLQSLPKGPVISADDIYYWGGLQYFARPLLQIKENQDPASTMDYFLEHSRKAGYNRLFIHESQQFPDSKKQITMKAIAEVHRLGLKTEPTVPDQGTQRFLEVKLSGPAQ